MIFNENEIRFITSGKLTHTTRPSRRDGSPPCRKGHSYALEKRTKPEDAPVQIKTTAHRLLVTSVKRDPAGWQITFQLDHRAPDIYMHARSERGYTTTPAHAMRGEPAATATTEDLERYAQTAEDKRAQQRRRQKERSLNARLKRARAAGVDTEPIIDNALGELDEQAA